MSNFDPNSGARWGQNMAQVGVRTQVDQGLRTYMLGVYNYMMLGLAVTALVAMMVNYFVVAKAPGEAVGMMGSVAITAFGAALYTSALKWVVIFLPLVFVMIFSFALNRLSIPAAQMLFLTFAAAMGLSLASLLLIYTGESVVRAFFITSAAFGGLSLYGYTTQRDLSAMGSFLVMGVIGLVIASLVNMFVQSSALQFGLSCLTVLIFSGLTAYDTQTIRQMYLAGEDYVASSRKSIYAALTLYLDFINIFMALVQLTGTRRD